MIIMFIIFNKTNKEIYSYGSGNPIESENKLFLGNAIICNDLTVCDWKYIADQVLEQDENGFVHDADYYETITPTDRLADIEAALLDLAEAIL